MSRLTRKASAIQLLSINVERAQTELQALHAEVANVKDALRRSHTAYAMLQDDVERFKGIVRAQDVALRGLREEVMSLRREVAGLTRLSVAENCVTAVNGKQERDAKEQVRKS
jgi:septation ring formation regulator EzrA